MQSFFSQQYGDVAPIPLQPVEQPNICPPDDTKYPPSVGEYRNASRPVTRRTSWGPGYVFYAWKWEMTAWLCGIGLFASMLAVLSRQNGRPVDDWNFPIKINSLVALLSTVYRAVMCAIAAEVISQSKWIWFWSTSRPVPLLHFQRFDSGSRGIWGAGRLLPLAVRRSPTALAAALAIVVSFAVGPFIQQAIGTIDLEYVLPQGDASLPVSRSLDGNSTYYRTLDSVVYGMWDFKYTTRAGLITALANPNSNDTSITPTCTSGNCTFPSWETGNVSASLDQVTHAAAGICNQCFDVTSLITNATATSNISYYPTYKLPTGSNITLGDRTTWMSIQTYANLSWASSVISDDQASVLRWALANVTILTVRKNNVSELEPSVPVSVACSLYTCLRSYSASVTNGILTEKLLHTTPMYPDVSNYTGDLVGMYSVYNDYGGILPQSNMTLSAIQSPCLVNGTVYTNTEKLAAAPNATTVRILAPSAAPNYAATRAPEACMYRVSGFYDMMLQGFLQRYLLRGYCSWDARQGDSIRCDDSYWLAQFWGGGLARAETMAATLDGFAEAATRRFRLGLGRATAQTDGDTVVHGASQRTGTFTRIGWPWLAFPALLLAAETVVLLWVIIRGLWYGSDGERVWKSSTLPILYYGPDCFVSEQGVPLREYMRPGGSSGTHAGDGVEGDLMTKKEMEDDARHVYVRLLKGGQSGATGPDQGMFGVDGSYRGVRRRRDWDQDSLLQQ
jgi:hypothetical protein